MHCEKKKCYNTHTHFDSFQQWFLNLHKIGRQRRAGPHFSGYPSDRWAFQWAQRTVTSNWSLLINFYSKAVRSAEVWGRCGPPLSFYLLEKIFQQSGWKSQRRGSALRSGPSWEFPHRRGSLRRPILWISNPGVYSQKDDLDALILPILRSATLGPRHTCTNLDGHREWLVS